MNSDQLGASTAWPATTRVRLWTCLALTLFVLAPPSTARAQADPVAAFEAHMSALDRVLALKHRAALAVRDADTREANELLEAIRADAVAAGWPPPSTPRPEVVEPLDDRERWRWYVALESRPLLRDLYDSHRRKGDASTLADPIELSQALVDWWLFESAAMLVRQALETGRWSAARRRELEAHIVTLTTASAADSIGEGLERHIWQHQHDLRRDRRQLTPALALWRDSGAWSDRGRAGALLVTMLEEAADDEGAGLARAWLASSAVLPDERADQLFRLGVDTLGGQGPRGAPSLVPDRGGALRHGRLARCCAHARYVPHVGGALRRGSSSVREARGRRPRPRHGSRVAAVGGGAPVGPWDAALRQGSPVGPWRPVPRAGPGTTSASRGNAAARVPTEMSVVRQRFLKDIPRSGCGATEPIPA